MAQISSIIFSILGKVGPKCRRSNFTPPMNHSLFGSASYFYLKTLATDIPK